MHQIEDLEPPDDGILVTDGRLHFEDALLFCVLYAGFKDRYWAMSYVRSARGDKDLSEIEVVMPDGSIAVYQT